MRTLKELKSNFVSRLFEVYPKQEIETFFYILCDFFLNYSRFQVSLNMHTEVSVENQAHFENAIDRLLDNEPIQYITGETEFFGLPFKVNTHTLIPRPETEELVELILLDIGHTERSRSENEFGILDIGTGSGCIAIALAKNLKKAKVSAMDVSKGAIAKATENAAINKASVTFIEQDILQTTTLAQQYDIIVSNPPYVRQLEKTEMKPNVLVYEPDSALFVSDNDPLIFYRKIAELALKHLRVHGWLYFEINEYLGEEMKELLHDIGFLNIELKNDFRNVPRMIKCQKG